MDGRTSQPVALPVEPSLERGVHEVDLNGNKVWFLVKANGEHVPGLYVADKRETDAEVRSRARADLNAIDPLPPARPVRHLALVTDSLPSSASPPSAR